MNVNIPNVEPKERNDLVSASSMSNPNGGGECGSPSCPGVLEAK